MGLFRYSLTDLLLDKASSTDMAPLRLGIGRKISPLAALPAPPPFRNPVAVSDRAPRAPAATTREAISLYNGLNSINIKIFLLLTDIYGTQ
jgi:hypothetical protein